MGTPHIAAEAGDFAPDVLMPGDPRRARRIADLVLARTLTPLRSLVQEDGQCVEKTGTARYESLTLRYEDGRYPVPRALRAP